MNPSPQLKALLHGSVGEKEQALKDIFLNEVLKEKVINTILHKGGSLQDAEDAFQDGFKTFYKQIIQGGFDGRSSAGTYFTGICIRKWLDTIKKKNRSHTVLKGDNTDLDTEMTETPEFILITEERRLLLNEVLDLLSERCKALIRMKYEGYNDSEIQQILKIDEGIVVRKLRHRCLENLRNIIQGSPHLLNLLKNF